MANTNFATGLTPIEDITSNPVPTHLYCVPASQGSNIFRGDPVVPLGTTDAYGVPNVGIATAGSGSYCLGPMVSIVNGPAAGANALTPVTRDLPLYRLASTLTYILVADDPNQRFVIQEDSVGSAIAVGSSAFEGGLFVAGTGVTATGISGWMLQSSSVSNAATRQLKILGLLRGPDNAIGNYAKWIVRINLHSLWNTSGI